MKLYQIESAPVARVSNNYGTADDAERRRFGRLLVEPFRNDGKAGSCVSCISEVGIKFESSL